MSETNAFGELLNNTVIRSDMTFSEQQEKYQLLYSFVQNKMPEMLFRYRKCQERSFDAFDRDYMWVSRADCMNDGFDSRLFFDRDQILSWRDYMLSDNNINEMRNFFLSDPELPESAVTFPGIANMLQSVKNTTEDEFIQFIDHYRYFVSTDIDKLMGILSGIMQQTLKFCCLSEKISSSAMWGHYSENETGFALAYDCRDLAQSIVQIQDKPRLCTCFPVIYGDKRYQVSTEYIKFMMHYNMLNKSMINSGYSAIYPEAAKAILNAISCPDVFAPTKIALSKSNEWAYEKEWRLFCMSQDQEFFTEEHSYFVMRPTALYLGRRISPINEKILVGIAKEKRLPIYKMALDDESFSYDLVAEEKVS